MLRSGALTLMALALMAGQLASQRVADPRIYIVARATGPVVIDGLADEAAWAAVGWSRDYVDILGDAWDRPTYYTRMKLRRLAHDFAEAGGGAIEVLSGRQTPDQVAKLQRLAEEFDLEISAGSDFHRDGPYHPDIGVELRAFCGKAAVWHRFAAPGSIG